jgi:hypothetical protein
MREFFENMRKKMAERELCGVELPFSATMTDFPCSSLLQLGHLALSSVVSGAAGAVVPMVTFSQ